MPDITFHSIDSEGGILSASLVKIYNQAGTLLIDYGTTSDTEGTLTVFLPEATYWVRTYKSEYAFSKRLQLTVGSLAESINLVGASTVDYLPSGAPEICRISGIIYGASGEPIESGFATFILSENCYRVNESGLLGSATVKVASDKFGRVSFELFRNAKYECRIKSRQDKSIVVTVPDLEICKLSDLVFPIGSEFSSDSTVSGTTGSELEIPFTYKISLGREITDRESLSDFFEISEGASLSSDKIRFDTSVAKSFSVYVYGISKEATLLGTSKKLLKTIEVTIND